MFKAGSIRKVELKNFVTYTYVEMFPGPYLNMIIGPNGTGKSTIVAAIILGLGGTPKVVGRGTKISEYVKHKSNSAVITIILQDEIENQYIKVTREFDTRDRNLWKLNNQKVKFEEVLECIKKFNIQVNNLCQFLPQDRVQDFVKLNKKELLKETQVALCRYDLIEKQETLIQIRDDHKKLLDTLTKLDKNLDQAKNLNLRMEGRVMSFNKKKEYLEKIDNIDRKIQWMIYEDFRIQLTDIKKDRSKADELYNKYKKILKPMEQQINFIKKYITQKQDNNMKISHEINNIRTCISTNRDKWKKLRDSIKKIEDDVQHKLAEIDLWDKEIDNVSLKLEDMKKLQREVNIKNAANTDENNALSLEVNKLLELQKKLRNQEEEITQAKQDSLNKVRALEHEAQRLENVKRSRLQLLERTNADAFKAVNWLRNNKRLFEGEIFEPIMLEINILDSRFTKYVENVIPMRDRLAFTCVIKNDMNKLIKCLRESQKLSVNVVHSEAIDANTFQPNTPIERLRRYGFLNYINNLFSAPVPIMNYLCKTYYLHNLPVGDHRVNDNYEHIPNEIKQFFSDNYRYNISFSKYSGQKSIRQNQVVADRGLSLSLDIIKLNQLKGKISETQNAVESYNLQFQTLKQQMSKFEEKIGLFRDRMKKIQQETLHAHTIDSRIQTTLATISEMQKMKKKPEDIESEGKNKVRIVVKNLKTIQETFKEYLAKLCDAKKDHALVTMNIELDRKKIAYIDNTMKENQKHCLEAEETLNLIKDKYNDVMSQAKAVLIKAKGLSKGFTPADDGFKQFYVEYEKLPTDIQELNILKEQFHSRLACLNIADDDEMREYEQRVEEIKNFVEQIEQTNSTLNVLSSKMNRLQENWLTPLRELVSQINFRFARAFEKMGCAGEVSICSGDNDKEFSQYGISIKVTYRNGELLQELNSVTQSGGERAVATAAYMLALQELTPVPFRCVDEINQGMDSNNERRIFELILNCICEKNSSQYFLITPKLTHHLDYSSNMVIHIVHNGPFVPQDKKWGFSKICNSKKIQII